MSSGPFLTRRALLSGSVGLAAALAAGCSTGRSSQGGVASAPSAAPVSPPSPVPSTATASAASAATAEPAAVAARATVPVLRWHQLRDWRASDADYSRRLLICPLAALRAQLDTLAEDGWTAISPVAISSI